MRLIACHVENFGKLSDLSMNFEEGVNVINESNAWGKSTLAAFLKAMFYGLDTKKDAKAFEKERTLYRPWQGGAFGGEVDFEVDGKSYRISRSFGRTEKTDEFHLYDLATNLESQDYTDEIGLELFELDSNSFKKSIYIAQNDCGSETSDRINAKLGNLSETAADLSDYEAASRRMKEMQNALTPDRVTGSIKRRRNIITQMTQELRSYEAAEEGLEGIRSKERLVQSQVEELMQIRRDYADALVIASEDSRRQELYLQYDALCAEVEEKAKKRDEFLTVFPNGMPSQQMMEEQMEKAREMEAAKVTNKTQEFTETEKAQKMLLDDMFREGIPTDEQIDSSLDMLVETEKQKEEIARQEARLAVYEEEVDAEKEMPSFSGRVSGKALLCVGAGMALAGAAVFAVAFFKLIALPSRIGAMVAGGAAAGIGIALLVTGLIVYNRYKQERQAWIDKDQKERQEARDRFCELSDALKTMRREVRKVHDAVGEYLGGYQIFCESKDFQARLYELKNQVNEYERLKRRQEMIDNHMTVYEVLRTEILTFASSYGVEMNEDPTLGLSILQKKMTEYQLAQEACQESQQKKEDFEQRQEKSFWTRERLCPYSLSELNQMIEEADRKLEELKAAHNQYQKQMEEYQEQLDLRDEKKEELQEQLELQEKDTRAYEIVSKTQDFLQKAKEQLTARYMEPIANGFAKYYGMLTGESEDDWMIDANLELRKKEYGELRDTRYLSAGYQDLSGVCMRLAIVDAMYQDEKPFLILDDPFVNLDKEKVESGNRFLLSVAEEYQVIYFTCHDSRSPL